MSENFYDDDNEGWCWYNWQQTDTTYTENTNKEFGVTHKWENAKTLDSLHTRRGTYVEMISRPKWGVACYMDNSIQSCTMDERFYHESLVHPVMSTVQTPKRVCIIGGGEGATAREVLKFPGVEHIDMYEWDKDVVTLFREKYPQWAKGAWSDSRLHLHYDDIFNIITTTPSQKYDVIIIDLFEPTEENNKQWTTLLENIGRWLEPNGSIVMYAGMRNIFVDKQPYQRLVGILREKYNTKEIVPYRVWIPSFSGESCFILVTSSQLGYTKMSEIGSHLNEAVWNSYKTLNW